MAFGLGKSKKAGEKQAAETATEQQDASSTTTDQATGEEQQGADVPSPVGSGKPANIRQISPQVVKDAQTTRMTTNFGNIVTVLMQSPAHKKLTLEDLNWLVLPALLCNQFIVAEARRKDTGFAQPIGLAFWAKVSEEVDEKLSSDLDKPIRMSREDWRSGDIFWLIELVGDNRFVTSMMQDLNKNVFKGQPVKFRTLDENKNKVVKIIRAGENNPNENGSGEASPSES